MNVKIVKFEVAVRDLVVTMGVIIGFVASLHIPYPA